MAAWVTCLEGPVGQHKNAGRTGVYSREDAERLLHSWPELHEYARQSPEPGQPPPRRRDGNPMETLLCRKADIETAAEQVPRHWQREIVEWHFRDGETYATIARTRLGGMVGEEAVGSFARLGAKMMIAWLTGE